LFRYARRPHPVDVPSDESQFSSGVRNSNAKVRIAGVAARQQGRIRYDQLTTLGIGRATIRRWIDAGYLHQELPRVYAVGHRAQSTEADLSAALLYAGPGAMLSHGTAIWWLGLLNYPPAGLHVSTPRRVKSLGEIVVHGGRRLERTVHRALPVTTVSRSLLDLAAASRPDLLRLALANADYGSVLDLDGLEAIMGRGISGTAALREALKAHLPQLAHTRSEAERLLLALCREQDLPIPASNVMVEGWLVDALWADAKVVVEIDGWRGHRSRAQLERDHQRDLELRRAGYTVLRYTWRQLHDTPDVVADELGRYV
jgi:very-short-patch-repair endonuclease